jgi:hypothetical protein
MCVLGSVGLAGAAGGVSSPEAGIDCQYARSVTGVFYGDGFLAPAQVGKWDWDGNALEITSVSADSVVANWASTQGVGVVVVSANGGALQMAFRYDPPATGGTVGNANVVVDHITFCWNPPPPPPPPPPPSQWCSPGYWRNHATSWGPTGLSPSALYASYITDPAVKGRPTVLDVLQAPQKYGGSAFNAVADLLSDRHPNLNWGYGDPRTDNCPLN